MAEGGWIGATWRFLDGALRSLNDKLRKQLRLLRILRAVLAVSVIGAWLFAFFAWNNPEYAAYLYGGAILFLSLPGIYLWVMLGIPLAASSVVRLVDKGYPDNAKELAIRVVAQKLHDESIKTEELLVDTAINEGKKAYRKYKERAADMQEDLEPEKE